jgi:hypothetical protein
MAKVEKKRSSRGFALRHVEESSERALGFAAGEITDLDLGAWAKLDAEFNALFLAT